MFVVLWAIVFKWYMSDGVSTSVKKKKKDGLWFWYRKLSRTISRPGTLASPQLPKNKKTARKTNNSS